MRWVEKQQKSILIIGEIREVNLTCALGKRSIRALFSCCFGRLDRKGISESGSVGLSALVHVHMRSPYTQEHIDQG